MDQIIADMVREQRELRRTIACLEHRLAKAGEGFKAALDAVRSYKPSDEQQLDIHFPPHLAFPESDEFRVLLRDLKDARFKLQEVNRRLDQI